MKRKICLLGIFAFVTLAIAAPRTWVLKTGETVTGDYVSSGTTTLVVKIAGTNCFLKISSLSTNDQAYAAEMQARIAKDNGDIRYYSTTLGVWTNAASLFKYATNHSVGGKVIVEIGNAGYVPAEMWLGNQYESQKDPGGTIGMAIESGFRDNSPDKNTPYAKVVLPTGHIVMYDGSDPFADESARWYFKAATQGVADAQCKLGDYYRSYSGNYTEALKWYGFAVANGNKKAMSGMAGMYAKGLGVQKDLDKATQLYATGEAYFELSRLYFKNDNHIAAYTWWCVGNNTKVRQSDYPFSSDYANLNFTAAERTIGANAAATYIAQRYGVNTNAIPTRPNSAKSKPTQ